MVYLKEHKLWVQKAWVVALPAITSYAAGWLSPLSLNFQEDICPIYHFVA